jgi:hypothetical protein
MALQRGGQASTGRHSGGARMICGACGARGGKGKRAGTKCACGAVFGGKTPTRTVAAVSERVELRLRIRELEEEVSRLKRELALVNARPDRVEATAKELEGFGKVKHDQRPVMLDGHGDTCMCLYCRAARAQRAISRSQR